MVLPNFPLVSVVIPAYNAEYFIEECLRSASEQTYPNLEIIVVVDRSSDATFDVAKNFSKHDSRVVVINKSFSCGASIARNIGIEHANGSFIAFLDADDIWLPDKLSIQIPFFLSTCSPSIVFGSYINYNESRQSIQRVSAPYGLVDYASIIRTNSIGTSTAVIDIRSAKYYFPNLPRRQDWALWISILSNSNTFAIATPKFVAKRRIHSKSLSSNILASYYYNYIVLREIAGFSRSRALWGLMDHSRQAVLRKF
jgi:teichuronic acid biosynthesis glycosyltransferase TuaG